MIRVLFICLGNICRSPMAEAVFMHKVREAALQGEIEADSAGTGDWHRGQPPHRGTQQILKERGVAFTHAARQITDADFNHFDYIVTMDDSNYADVSQLMQDADLPQNGDNKCAHLVRMMDFAPHIAAAEVPDPYHTGRFAEVYRLVEQAAEGLLAAIRQERSL